MKTLVVGQCGGEEVKKNYMLMLVPKTQCGVCFIPLNAFLYHTNDITPPPHDRYYPCIHIVHKLLCIIFECSCSKLIGARSTANEFCSTFMCDNHGKYLRNDKCKYKMHIVTITEIPITI